MKQILAEFSASITELKKNPTALLNQSGGNPVAILNHNTPAAYFIGAHVFEQIMDMLDDIDLAEEVKARLSQDHRIVAVDIEDLA
jgi:antitoxin StbD